MAVLLDDLHVSEQAIKTRLFSSKDAHLLRGIILTLGKSRGIFSLATLRWAATALLGILKSACSFSVGLLTLQPSSMKYCDIL